MIVAFVERHQVLGARGQKPDWLELVGLQLDLNNFLKNVFTLLLCHDEVVWVLRLKDESFDLLLLLRLVVIGAVKSTLFDLLALA